MINVPAFTLEKVGDLAWYYIGEVIQALVALLIYKYLTAKGALDIQRVVHAGLIIGAITTVIEYFDPSFNRTVKTGAMMSIGSNLVKNIK